MNDCSWSYSFVLIPLPSLFIYHYSCCYFFLLLKVPLRNENSTHLCYLPFETEMKNKTAENNVECFMLVSPAVFHSYFSMLNVSLSFLSFFMLARRAVHFGKKKFSSTQHESDHIIETYH